MNWFYINSTRSFLISLLSKLRRSLITAFRRRKRKRRNHSFSNLLRRVLMSRNKVLFSNKLRELYLMLVVK
jgi:hypothetical protein